MVESDWKTRMHHTRNKVGSRRRMGRMAREKMGISWEGRMRGRRSQKKSKITLMFLGNQRRWRAHSRLHLRDSPQLRHSRLTVPLKNKGSRRSVNREWGRVDGRSTTSKKLIGAENRLSLFGWTKGTLLTTTSHWNFMSPCVPQQRKQIQKEENRMSFHALRKWNKPL